MTPMKRLRTLVSFRHKTKPANEKPTSFPKTELTLKILTLVAAVVGGVWAFHLYQLAGGDGWAINVKLETKVLPYHNNLRLLVVNIKSLNSRNFELDPDKGDLYELNFRRFPSSVNKETVVDENGGELIQKVSLLNGEPYDFIPGLEMDNMQTIVVPSKTIVSLTAKIQKQTGKIDKKTGKPDFDYVLSSTVVRVE
jgi:hypothetical protein